MYVYTYICVCTYIYTHTYIYNMCNVYFCLLIRMFYCILYHHIISKFHSFLDQLPEAFKKINVKSESKAKVILNDGKKNTCHKYTYEILMVTP